MRNDIVTFFGPRDHGGLSPYLHQSESKSWFAYSVGDLSNSRDTDRIKVLQQGGVVVQVDHGASDVTGVVIGTWKGASYEPPARLLVLHLDRSPEWVDLKPGTKEIALEPGSHVLLPLDHNSELALENLRRGLEYLPLDYEITVLNVLRRPSLEWRVSRLERAARPEQSARESVAVGAETGALNSLLRWRRISLLQVATVLLLLVLFVLAGYFLLSARSDPPTAPPQTKTANRFTDNSSPAGHGSTTSGSANNLQPVIANGDNRGVRQASKTSTIIQTSAAVSSFGSPVTFTATVSSANGNSPAGSVQFMDGNKRLSTPRRLSASGVAVLTVRHFQIGPHEIQALYLSDANFQPSRSQVVSQTVIPVQVQTQTDLQISKGKGKAQGIVEVEVTCINSDTIPTGEVQIDLGDGRLDRKPLSNDGIVDFDIAEFRLRKGSYQITATYLGGPGFRSSVSRSAWLPVK